MLHSIRYILSCHLFGPGVQVAHFENGIGKIRVTPMVLGAFDLVGKGDRHTGTNALGDFFQHSRRVQQHVFKPHNQSGVVGFEHVLSIPAVVKVNQRFPFYYLVLIKRYCNIDWIAQVGAKLFVIVPCGDQVWAVLPPSLPFGCVCAFALISNRQQEQQR